MKEAFLILGRGVGQVMFQNNALSGLLMLAGILLNSWQMALLAIAGNVVSTLTACLSGYSREDIRNGLYGFNGTLVGIAIGVFMPVSVASFSLFKLVNIVGAEFPCVDTGFGTNKPVDAVIRPEDIDLVKPEEGTLKGVVTHLIFK